MTLPCRPKFRHSRCWGHSVLTFRSEGDERALLSLCMAWDLSPCAIIFFMKVCCLFNRVRSACDQTVIRRLRNIGVNRESQKLSGIPEKKNILVTHRNAQQPFGCVLCWEPPYSVKSQHWRSLTLWQCAKFQELVKLTNALAYSLCI